MWTEKSWKNSNNKKWIYGRCDFIWRNDNTLWVIAAIRKNSTQRILLLFWEISILTTETSTKRLCSLYLKYYNVLLCVLERKKTKQKILNSITGRTVLLHFGFIFSQFHWQTQAAADDGKEKFTKCFSSSVTPQRKQTPQRKRWLKFMHPLFHSK